MPAQNDFDSVAVPAVTAQRFADLVGLPLGVVEAQMDKRQLPVFRLGKRRFVNMVAFQKMVTDDTNSISHAKSGGV